MGLQYTEVLFKAKGAYYFDYLKGGGKNVKNWDFNGYVFPLNCLKFGDKWYMSKQSITHKPERKKIAHTYFNLNDKNKLVVLKKATKCFFGKANRFKLISFC